jgi:DNA-binding protein YbaB
MPTELKFGVTADGAASPTDRLVILPAGAVKATTRLIIDNDVVSGYRLNIEAGGNNSESGIIINDKDAIEGFTFMAFRRSGTEIGSISRNSTNDAVQYTTSSDYRLKDGIVDKTDGITKLKQLKPRKFYWKSNADKTLVDGFIAHEVSSIVPEAISGTKDATETLQKVVVSASGDVVRTNIEQADWTHGKTEEGGKIYASNTTWEATKEIIQPQGIDQSKLVPLLTAALKEAITKIEALEARVTTLEG